MGNIGKKILKGTLITGGILSLTGLCWMHHDTYRDREEIKKEAIETGKGIYEIATERGRSDVIDMQIMSDSIYIIRDGLLREHFTKKE